MKYKLILILTLILTGLAVIFTIQNVAVVDIRFLLWSLTMSKALLMFILLAVGIIIGWLLNSLSKHLK